MLTNRFETSEVPALPADLEAAVGDLAVDAELVMRYCSGPRIERTARVAIANTDTPDEPVRQRVAVGVMERMAS